MQSVYCDGARLRVHGFWFPRYDVGDVSVQSDGSARIIETRHGRDLVKLVRSDGLVTFEGTEVRALVGMHVRIRPFYHVPRSRSCMESVRCAWTFLATVVEPYTTEALIVEFLDRGPWDQKAAHYPREMHAVECRCDACIGDGLDQWGGA